MEINMQALCPFLSWTGQLNMDADVDINDQLIIIDYRWNIEIYNTIILTDIYIHIVHILKKK